MKNKKLIYVILALLILVIGIVSLFTFISNKSTIGVPDKSRYCVDYAGNPDPSGPCSTVKLEARKCKNIGDCTATCAYGCVNKNRMSGGADCEVIPQYQCECINNFCQKK